MFVFYVCCREANKVIYISISYKLLFNLVAAPAFGKAGAQPGHDGLEMGYTLVAYS